MQNIGLGDGLTILLSILSIVFYKNLVSSFLCFLLIGLWHPGQSFFIIFSALISLFLKEKSSIDKDKINLNHFKEYKIYYFFSSITAFVLSRIILNIYNIKLGFTYINRLDYLLSEAPKFAIDNLIYSPISLIFPITIFIVFSFKITNLKPLIKYSILIWIIISSSSFYLIISSIISLLTTDVSRVANLILLPLYLNILEHLSIYEIFSTSNLFLFDKKNIILIGIIFLIAVLPLYGWDGINFSLWKDFFEDACKYGLYCDNPFLR